MVYLAVCRLLEKHIRSDAFQATILDVCIANITVGLDDTPLKEVAPLDSYNKTESNPSAATGNTSNGNAADSSTDGQASDAANGSSSAGQASTGDGAGSGATTQDASVNGQADMCGKKRGRESPDATSPSKRQKKNDGAAATVVHEEIKDKKPVTGKA